MRIVDAEYLVAMKLMSARQYKHDLSDIIGIITEEKEINPDFSKQKIMDAYKDMYEQTPVDEIAMMCVDSTFETTNPKKLIEQMRTDEEQANKMLKDFQEKYPNTLNETNINNILETISKKENNNRPLPYMDTFDYDTEDDNSYDS